MSEARGFTWIEDGRVKTLARWDRMAGTVLLATESDLRAWAASQGYALVRLRGEEASDDDLAAIEESAYTGEFGYAVEQRRALYNAGRAAEAAKLEAACQKLREAVQALATAGTDADRTEAETCSACGGSGQTLDSCGSCWSRCGACTGKAATSSQPADVDASVIASSKSISSSTKPATGDHDFSGQSDLASAKCRRCGVEPADYLHQPMPACVPANSPGSEPRPSAIDRAVRALYDIRHELMTARRVGAFSSAQAVALTVIESAIDCLEAGDTASGCGACCEDEERGSVKCDCQRFREPIECDECEGAGEVDVTGADIGAGQLEQTLPCPKCRPVEYERVVREHLQP